MIFHPQNTVKTDGSFVFSGNINAVAHSCINKAIIKEFWNNFTFKCATLTVTECDEFVFSIGNAKKLPLDGYAYSINVESDGVCVYAENEKDLLLGFMTLIDRFKAVDTDGGAACEIECCQIKDKPIIHNRMVHLCIFPQTELWELQRFVRFCGALKYTHIVLEFWGMLKYDCMKELSWSHGFTKEQIRPIIREAKDLGLEVIPMFNHWGHASASRAMHGKHVVLDQNLALQTYFSEDGWCWDIFKPKVRELLRQIRNELIELCGEGSYFHIGCDEAYNFVFTQETMDFICDFINEISAELRAKNRRTIVWGDMFLYRYPHYNLKNRYACFSPSPEAEKYMLGRLSRDVLIADWQYEATEAPIETPKVFLDAGFDCVFCPWDRGVTQMKLAISTVKENSLSGFLHTTWDSLSSGMPFVAFAAVGGFESIDGYKKKHELGTYAAGLLRKVMPISGDYAKAGWSKLEINDKC